MSTLLPILGSPEHSSTVSGGITAEPSGNAKNQSTPFQHTVSPAFAQVLREHRVISSRQGHVEPLASTDGKTDDTPLSVLTKKEIGNLEVLLASDSIEHAFRESQGYGLSTQEPRELLTQPTKSQDGAPEPARFVPSTVADSLVVDTEKNRIQPSLLHGIGLAISHTSLDHSQAHAHGFVQKPGLQSTGGESISGGVNQTRGIKPPVSEFVGVVPQGSLSKAPDVHASSSQGLQGLEVKLAPVGKDAPVALPQANPVNQQAEPLKITNHLSQTHSTPHLQPLRQTDVRLAPPVSPAGPAGFAQTDSVSQLVAKPIPGSASIVQDLSSPVIENRTTLQIDPLGDTGLLNKADRSQSTIETSAKIVGLDASGSQGLGSGMNYPQNSQAGYQQSFTTGQSVSVRGLEERTAEFPAPALQRLQMDVQLSETQRVSIDVGVQNRQVYAGLVTDHAVLRNLATQFIPQLENQLADVDLELQEFSAEVREERQQQDDAIFRHSHFAGQGTQRASQEEVLSPESSLKRQEDPGLHLVA